MARLRERAAFFLQSTLPFTGDLQTEEMKRMKEAALDHAYGPEEQLGPKEARRRKAADLLIDGDPCAPGLVRTNAKTAMAPEEVKRYIDEELAESFYPGVVRAWNLARWTKNRMLLKVLLRAPPVRNTPSPRFPEMRFPSGGTTNTGVTFPLSPVGSFVCPVAASVYSLPPIVLSIARFLSTTP